MQRDSRNPLPQQEIGKKWIFESKGTASVFPKPYINNTLFHVHASKTTLRPLHLTQNLKLSHDAA